MEFIQKQKLYTDIVQEAWKDADFKKQLIDNPVEAIEKLTGIKLNIPEGKTLAVGDQTDESIIYINIPIDPKNNQDLELNEEQLKTVAGGTIAVTYTDFITHTITYNIDRDSFLESI